MNVPARPTRPHLADRYDRKLGTVIRGAAHAFAERGYAQTTIQELARSLDWSAGGIYHYVGSKEQLLRLVCEQLMDPLLERAAALLVAAPGPPAVALRGITRLWVAHVAEHRDHMLVFLQQRHVIDHGPGWQEVREHRKAFEKLVEGVLAEVAADGELAAGGDPRLALGALLGMVNYTAQWYRPRGRLSPTEIADGYVDLLLT